MNNEFEKLTNLINQYNSIYILRHKSPDGDALGSQYALLNFIKTNFHEKEVFAVTSHIENEYVYFLEKLFPITEKKDISSIKNSLIIILDTSSIERISVKIENLDKSNFLIKIDHHPNLEEFENFRVQNITYSSTCELLADYFFSSSNFKINDIIAKYLYIGMVTDTGRFLYPSTNKKTFEIIAKLYDYNVNFSEINEILTYKKDNVLNLQKYIQQKMKVKNNVAYLLLKKNVYEKFNCSYEEASSQVNTLMQSENVKKAVYGVWNPKTKLYKVSLRSKFDPINHIAEAFGGGGHKLACGLTLTKKEQFKLILNEVLK